MGLLQALTAADGCLLDLPFWGDDAWREMLRVGLQAESQSLVMGAE